MNKVFVITGKSSTGKDTLFQRLKEEMTELEFVVPYTTRPMRENEKQGREYNFVTEEQLNRLRDRGRILEQRTYFTVKGVWIYATVDYGWVNSDKDVIVIATLEALDRLKDWLGKRVIPILIEVEQGERLQRALNREKTRANPDYRELCRRFLKDEEDFSQEMIDKYNPVVIKNESLDKAFKDIKKLIEEK